MKGRSDFRSSRTQLTKRLLGMRAPLFSTTFDRCVTALREGRTYDAARILKSIEPGALAPAAAALYSSLRARIPPLPDQGVALRQVGAPLVNAAPISVDLDRMPRERPRISLVTSVFNRFWQLHQTLPRNLQTIRGQNEIDLVVVDFGGTDSPEIREFIEREFALDLLTGQLKYFVARLPWTRFHMATAKNVAHRLSLGAFIFSLDSDNYFLPEDLVLVREHMHGEPSAVLHQTTGPAPMCHAMWAKYGLFTDAGQYHEEDPSWDGSCGRIGVWRGAFERVNGYNENFVGMGMDDVDFLIRSMKAGAAYRHVRMVRPADQIFIDNGSAAATHEHDNNRSNWQAMDEALSAGRLVPLYHTDSPPERFRLHVAAMVERSAASRVTLFSSLFRIESWLERFLSDIGAITATPGVCVWLLDVVGSHPAWVSERLRAAADQQTVFYVPVPRDPGLYALWNIAIGWIRSPYLGNLNADDLRGSGWLAACLRELDSGLADLASPVTVPFSDPAATTHGATLGALRAEGGHEQRWFETRCVIDGNFPDEVVRHERLVDGSYSHEDLFQVLPDGSLSSYCIPNASAVWSRRVHDLAGGFDEATWGSFADLALWAEAGARGARFRQVDYPALFFTSEQQAHRRQARDEGRLVQLALRHGAPHVRRWTSRRLFDLSLVGGTYGGHHFMGWNWVRDEVCHHFRHTTPRVLLDMFVERSFFWHPDPAQQDFVHGQPWIGFVHTTPHHSPAFDHKGQNLDALLAEPRFANSLDSCRALIVLSQDNQHYLKGRLTEAGRHISLFRLFHPNVPMPEPSEPCAVDLGSADAPKTFHVGWHLRSFSAFAKLRLPRDRKVLLIPKNLPADYFLREVVDKELLLAGLGRAEEHFGAMYSASQSDYAHILRRGIIFNHYLQPSGSNLISECISARSRLVINRHPAFEEYLGPDYPLFYDREQDADATLESSFSRSSQARLQEYLYMLQARFSIEQFCRDLGRVGEQVYCSQ